MQILRHGLLLALLTPPMFADQPPPIMIFDGHSLTGWQGNEKFWRVDDEAITGEIPSGEALKENQFIFWDGELGDFELDLEFRLTGAPTANSGIQYRSQQLDDGKAAGYQADLDNGTKWLGRIYDEEGRALMVERGTRVSIAPDGRQWVDVFAPVDGFRDLFKPGEWNTYRITARASHVELWVNGRLCAVLDDHQVGQAEFSGKLAFQLHSGRGPAKIQFRNVQVTPLGRSVEPVPPVPGATVETHPLVAIAAAGPDGKPVNLGLETGTLEGWTAEGNAWTNQPVRYYEPATPRRKSDRPTDPVGSYWIGPGRRTGPVGTGQLTSPAFEVTHQWASYLVGGGSDINQTRVELVDEATGAIIHSSSGEGSGTLRRVILDFGSSVGRTVFIRLVDNAPDGPFSQVLYDDFVFHDRQPDFSATNTDTLHQHESAVLWHLQPNPAKPTEVANIDAQKVVRDMKVLEGFQAELIAAEPDIHQPIAFTFDERGRLWVAEAYSYPTKQPAGQGKDRIIILEDHNGDGSFETRKVFAEGLNLVSGIEIGFGGVWVGAAPELLFIPDRNHDDQPDGPAEVLLDGWGYQDTHETLNSFTWGPDGWLYGNQGVFTESKVGKPGTPEDQRLKLRAGVWRFHPLRHEFEVFAYGGSNQWGVDFNEAGHLFITHCRSFHGGGGTTQVIRNGHYWNQANSNYAPFVSNRAPDFAPGLKSYLPSSARYDSGEGGAGKPGSTAVYGGHSHVGTMIYLGDNWPEIYRDHLFTLNLHGHQMNHQHSVRQGSGYETFHAGYDLLYVPDKTFVGVDLQYGPDGAVYIIDWCDHQHCHSPRDDIWERTNGRLYRMAWKEAWKPVQVNLAAKSDTELAALHTHRNEWYVRTARRLLQERAAFRPLEAGSIGALRNQLAYAEETSQKLRALWTLQVIGALDTSDLATLLHHPSDLVRSWTVQFATERHLAPALPGASFVERAANDPSPLVRLALASALPTLPTDTRWAVVTALAGQGEDAADRFLPKLIWFGLAPIMANDYAQALDIAEATRLPSLADSIRWYSAQSAVGRDQLVSLLIKAPEDVAAHSMQVMAFALETETGLAMPTDWPVISQRFLRPGESTAESIAAAELSALFGDKAVLAQNRTLLANPQAPLADRQAALRLLKRTRDPAAISLYIQLLDTETFRSEVIPLLAGVDDPAVATGIVRIFTALAEDDRSAALASLTSHPTLGLALLKAIADGSFDKKYLTALHVRQLRNLHSIDIDSLLDRVWGKAADTTADIQATIGRYKTAYSEAALWTYSSTKGGQTYQQLCSACHTYEGHGGKLGPDLTGSWRNGLDYFIENIVDPNAVIGVDFQLNIITKLDDTVISGMVERETETSLVVRTPTEVLNVPKNQVARREVLQQSLMPQGLLQALPERDVIELLKFLTTKP